MCGPMEPDHFSYLGIRDNIGQPSPMCLGEQDRLRHLYTLGQTGTGKSTFLTNLAWQDVVAGQGVAVIDPHGDMVDALLDCIPSERTDDVIVFDPSDIEYPVGFNPLKTTESDDVAVTAGHLVSAFKAIWRDSWGPRMEYILFAACSSLAVCENTSVLGLERLLTNSYYRAWVVRQVNDPFLRSFWENQFDQYEQRLRQEIVAPILNKVGQLVMNPLLRNILGQVHPKLDFEFVMDRQRIFLANLGKGRLPREHANLLGALLVSQFHQTAMQRARISQHERIPFYLYADEFHRFASDNFAASLAEARKYGLGLSLGHQYIDQLDPRIRDAVFGNVGTIVAFRCGYRDAEALSEAFDRDYSPQAFTELSNYQAYVKSSANDTPATSKIWSYPPIKELTHRREKIIQRSREKYAVPRAKVEDKLRRWVRREDQFY